MKRYLKIYWLLSLYAIESSIATRWAMAIFIFGKLFRIILFGVFVYFLFAGAKGIAGYSKEQGFLFLSYFYLLSAVAQMLFREAYRFRPRLVSGEFDFDLVKPVHPILRSLLGGFDLHDFITLPIILLVFFKAVAAVGLGSSQIFLLIPLFISSLIILFSLHVFVAGLMTINFELDHGLMIYRDLEMLGRFPVDIYGEPLRLALTFILPVGLAFTLPIKIILGTSSLLFLPVSFFVAAASLFLSLKFWNFAIKKYSSASS